MRLPGSVRGRCPGNVYDKGVTSTRMGSVGVSKERGEQCRDECIVEESLWKTQSIWTGGLCRTDQYKVEEFYGRKILCTEVS